MVLNSHNIFNIFDKVKHRYKLLFFKEVECFGLFSGELGEGVALFHDAGWVVLDVGW